MVNSNGQRELAYLTKVTEVKPIVGSDNCECVVINGWESMVRKNMFHADDIVVYFETDSLLDSKNPAFSFLEKKHYKVKIQKYTFGGKGCFYSQGVVMQLSDLGWSLDENSPFNNHIIDSNKVVHWLDDDSRFVTKELNVKYSVQEDNVRKASSDPNAKYRSMCARHKKVFSKKPIRWLMKRDWGKKLLYVLFGKKKDVSATSWPVGKFEGVNKTDQERVENMKWVLEDKTPFIVTQKCDGSSGTYILERKSHNKFEFYVCSRNVRMLKEDQECFYGDHNYYWEVAKKYDIERKMKDYLNTYKDCTFVCWQGEICAPGIQKNPHHLKETHFYCFHWTDSVNGRLDIRKAENLWNWYSMEVVPIVGEIVLPDDFEEFKKSADGYYSKFVCEDDPTCPREGFVYYKTTDPTFSFKNVSREYLLNH